MILSGIFLTGVITGIVVAQIIRRRSVQHKERVARAVSRWRVITQLDGDLQPEHLTPTLMGLGAEELRIVARPAGSQSDNHLTVVVWFRWRAGQRTPEEAYKQVYGVDAPFTSKVADADAAAAADSWQPTDTRSAIA